MSLKAGDILDSYSGTTAEILGVEDDVIYLEIIRVPFWSSEAIGDTGVVLASDVNS